MKITNVTILILAIALALYILVPGLSWAEDGSALYTAKGSAFHVMRIPSGLGELARETRSTWEQRRCAGRKLDTRPAMRRNHERRLKAANISTAY